LDYNEKDELDDNFIFIFTSFSFLVEPNLSILPRDCQFNPLYLLTLNLCLPCVNTFILLV